MSSEWFLYIIRCGNGSLYTGITTDVERRFLEHQGKGTASGAKYLRGKMPLTLEFTTPAGDRSYASRLESRIKKMTKTQKEQLIVGARDLPTC